MSITVISTDLSISCPDDIMVDANPATCDQFINVPAPFIIETCGIDSVRNSFNNTADASDTYPVGVNEVLWVVYGTGGYNDTCSMIITVIDTDLSLVCPDDINVNSDSGDCDAFLNVPPPVTSSNCGIDSITNSFNGTDNATGNYPVGTTEVLWVVYGINGYNDSCIHVITVIDTELPNIICPDDITICGTNAIVDTAIGIDNCGIESIINDYNGTDNASGEYPSNDTTIVVWTVTDIHGNEANCSMVVTVYDNPSTAIAGPDQVFCEDPDTFGDLTYLEATPPSIGVGVWSVVQGEAYIADTLDPGTQVDTLYYGITIFEWSVSNGVCPKSISDVLIQVDQMPTVAYAGQDVITSFPDNFMDGNLPTVGDGYWTILDDSPGIIVDQTDPGTEIQDMRLGLNSFKWAITSGVCPPSSDSVRYEIQEFDPPQAISPNGDGYNDYFVIPEIERYGNVKFTVYNRWGTEVYHSDHYDNTWDGRANNTFIGNGVLPAGEYFYILEMGQGNKPITSFININP
ncbi:MAG: hypothetical protein DRR04_14565 [Gammaproteobacteria bacterium]|nr:MAG: hypothetical protein DRR04_14565 [Gammaproteobacteria bacterium]